MIDFTSVIANYYSMNEQLADKMILSLLFRLQDNWGVLFIIFGIFYHSIDVNSDDDVDQD